ncbi:MAG: hypothetical protein A3I66_10435 [Burkholderiales bacterium RIFCSPLOWO2_02_FULL_57_36]|nr:MAG: hypothetical protein A3I66_10435 [Burkholderiales bacterium RIFCSPLOWO2_02_FULL_57_36]
MDISFPYDQPGIYSLNKSVVFPAIVDGKNVSCEISEEALEQHFKGRPPPDYTKVEYDAAMLSAFEAARDRIETVAARQLEKNRGGACFLRPEDF